MTCNCTERAQTLNTISGPVSACEGHLPVRQVTDRGQPAVQRVEVQLKRRKELARLAAIPPEEHAQEVRTAGADLLTC